MLASLVALPDDLFVLLGDRGAGICYGKPDGVIIFEFQGDSDGTVFRSMIDGVVEKIPEYLTEL